MGGRRSHLHGLLFSQLGVLHPARAKTHGSAVQEAVRKLAIQPSINISFRPENENAPVLVEDLLPLLLHLLDLGHDAQGLAHQLAVVLDRAVAALLKLERGVLKRSRTTHETENRTTRGEMPLV